MGLRLREGIDLAALGIRTGFTPEALIVPDKAALYTDLGLLWRDGDRLGVTQAGMPLLDGLLGELVPGDLVGA